MEAQQRRARQRLSLWVHLKYSTMTIRYLSCSLRSKATMRRNQQNGGGASRLTESHACTGETKFASLIRNSQKDSLDEYVFESDVTGGQMQFREAYGRAKCRTKRCTRHYTRTGRCSASFVHIPAVAVYHGVTLPESMPMLTVHGPL